jgi:formiminotetrahydrofolate cyclodeaminase
MKGSDLDVQATILAGKRQLDENQKRTDAIEERLDAIDEALTMKIEEQARRNELAWEMRLTEHETRIRRRDFFAAHALAALVSTRSALSAMRLAELAKEQADALLNMLDTAEKRDG